ncbi:DUF2726 domain-containing protein [uncultured Clostridium sp.]|uniref:DUF2726 domain-containing protein n=1 Tax=uncultured Clostridium sp. TaxID=59620 RepID=UPI0025FB0716|nr:DUF2726 domain-containing protein [uncultured Clostridium sp.]
MTNKKIEIRAGERYNSLTVISQAEDYISPKGKHEKRYLCRCECGAEYIVKGTLLRNGRIKCCPTCSKKLNGDKKVRDLKECRFGRWTVLEREKFNKVGVYWRCRCDCGVEKIIRGTSLTSGNSTSCGCYASENLRKNKMLNLVGKKFGRLLVLEQVEDFQSPTNGKKRSRWKCQCDCGNIVYVNGTDLKSGNTNSCGCYKIERTSEIHFQDLSGKRFGMLQVIRRVEDYVTPENGRVRAQFLCQCDCGNQKIIQRDSLMNGTISCGCINSKGERTIAEYLRKENIKYKIQYGFPDLVGGAPLKFDFAIFDKNEKLVALIEYQGEQHYSVINFFGGEKKFEKQRENDEAKRFYCKNRGICLIEIPYWEEVDKYLEKLKQYKGN